jgi:hypothetical protein
MINIFYNFLNQFSAIMWDLWVEDQLKLSDCLVFVVQIYFVIVSDDVGTILVEEVGLFWTAWQHNHSF